MEVHGDVSPREFYAQDQYLGSEYEGLQEALADIEWGTHFEQDTGDKPSEYDWRNWWFEKRGISPPETRISREEYRGKRARRSQKWRKKSRIEEEIEPGENRRWWFGEMNEPLRWKDWEKLSPQAQMDLQDMAADGTDKSKWWGYDALRLPKTKDVPMGYERPPQYIPPRTTWMT